VPLVVDIPGVRSLELHFLLLDVNGTLSDRGVLIDGVAERLDALRDRLEPRLLSADTFGTLASMAEQLSAPAQTVASGAEKLAVLNELGAATCVAIGNGTNDAPMLSAAALGVAVIGLEGTSSQALGAADIVCSSVLEALDLLREPKAIAATLRA
jgi:P-type E1-E2 ATPase